MRNRLLQSMFLGALLLLVMIASGCGGDENKGFQQPGPMNPDGTPQEPTKYPPASAIPPPPKFGR